LVLALYKVALDSLMKSSYFDRYARSLRPMWAFTSSRSTSLLRSK